MSYVYDYEPIPLENEMNDEDFFEALRWQLDEELVEQITANVKATHILLASPSMQTKAKRIIDEFKSFCDDKETLTVTMQTYPDVSNSLHILIACNDFGMEKDEYNSFIKTLQETDVLLISAGKEEDTIRIDITIENFYKKIG